MKDPRLINGDEIHGDKLDGDKVAGDKVVVSPRVGDMHGSMGITAGRDVIYTADATGSEMRLVNDYLARAATAYEARMYQLVARPAALPDQPYKFLYAFEMEDADIFFGRDAGSEALYKTILKDRLTILHAKSGAGKTSLLNAGLSPRLIREGRLPVYAHAYEDPVLAIKQVIAPPSLGPWPELLPKLTLHEFLGLTCAHLSRQTQELVVILDQFEEFFVFWPERDRRQPFINALADCYNDKALPVRLVIALRKDYYSDLADFQERIPAVFYNEYRLGTMTREEAQVAITGPVAKLGCPVAYEQDLLDMLLDDLARGGMELPHLQIICTQLYEALAQGETAIPLASYEKLGRAEGVLSGYLNSVLDRLPGRGGAIAREVLKELVSSEATKRALSYGTLTARVEAEGDELDDVLAQLVDARLLRRDETAGEIVYEMAHEYLTGEIEKWISSEEMEVKEAQDILRREITSWYKHGALVSSQKLKIIEAYREKLRLNEEEERILSLSNKVYSISEKLGIEEDMEDLAAKILETALEISNADGGWLLRDKLGRFVVTVSGRRTELGRVQMDKTPKLVLRTEEGIIAQVLKDRNACIKNGFMSDELQLAESRPVLIKSFLCVPINIASSETAWGAIGLSRQAPSSTHFNVQDANLVQSLARSATLAVQNTLFYQGYQRFEEEERRKPKQLEIARDRTRAIYEMPSTFSTIPNYYHVLNTMLDISIGFGGTTQEGARSVGIVLLYQQTAEGDCLGVEAARNLSRHDENCKLTGTAGAIEQALSSSEPVIVGRVENDPELRQFSALHRCRSVICIPLRAGFEIYGVVVLGSPRVGIYTPEHMAFLTALCNQTIVALQNVALYHSLREEKEKIIDADAETRKKLARDLHDGPLQSIAAMAMRLNYTGLLLEREPGKAKEELEAIQALALRVIREMRLMAFTVRPVILETQGLIPTLEYYLTQLGEETGIAVHLEAPDPGERLNAKIEGVTFSIIEEAINNAKKHAQARNIWVRLGFEDDFFFAMVEDDGQGFDVEEVLDYYDQRGGLGLINMRERAELIEGAWTIESAVDQGTKVTLIVPLPEEEI